MAAGGSPAAAQGLVLDYVTLNSNQTHYTFRGLRLEHGAEGSQRFGKPGRQLRGVSGRRGNAERRPPDDPWSQPGVVYPSNRLTLTNSLPISVTNWTYSYAGAHNATNSGSSVFDPIGAGHYLAANAAK